jgi:anti-sigma factor RsiW
MTSLLNKRKAECRGFRSQLEDAAGAAPNAKELSELLAAAPTAFKEHATACPDCRAAAENILETRALLVDLPSSADIAGPWFAPRVMAAIAARKAELSRAADTWTFLPKLAARLTWASAVALLLASGWLYQWPVSTSAKPVVTDITGEPVVDTITPANNDEVLVSLSERSR